MSPDRSPAVQEAIRQAVPVSTATGPYGACFGALAVAAASTSRRSQLSVS